MHSTNAPAGTAFEQMLAWHRSIRFPLRSRFPVGAGADLLLIATALAIVSWDTVRRHREVDPQMGQE
jgi:hypothetical protein